MRKFPRICDPADCKRCDLAEDSVGCLIRKAHVCSQLMAAPVAQHYRDEIEKLSFDMIEEAGALSDNENLARQDGMGIAFRRESQS